MQTRFIDYVNKKQLFEPHQKVLLAVSGGIDSMVLLHLFEKSGFQYGVVHCNFQLRGEDSDKDEDFVKQHVCSHGVPFFNTRFETEEYAGLNGISIEMAARELRYNYFEQIRANNNYDFIATAHHQDDLLETFFLNLSRKTGIRGLTGIKEKSGCLIRPLLFANRKEIDDFARTSFIEYREDRTNSEVVYQRNFIRHRILPLFQSLNPAFSNNLSETISNLRETEEVYTFFIEEEKKKAVSVKGTETSVKIERLLSSPFPRVLLFEILTGYGFNPKVISQVFQSLNNFSGKQFLSKTHRLVKDREQLFITQLPENGKQVFYVEEDETRLFEPLNLVVEKMPAENFQLEKSPDVACLDLDKLEFPLLIRKWQHGDYFQPLGMTGFKKLSDFFIDEKIPVHEKENTWLLCSGQKIVWVVGHRIDNRFKVTSATRQMAKIRLNKS
ncbi:tRNA(Ile)-lysidine synthase [Mariniphaga anaerophila]|uniref:tRNA(Ile)-lysidine synthase n=1 Tax=Mariniphaga anaerophila TaxID=1484053 RepID=A0A1M4WSM3_9BACT|nr:tRNA lysidine(34) synthetase TilS [Mariniphaga anaerophila]SHE84157.1 tRNA(Ile)-lysidine synthase [Mariniphaga anaerophila]